MGSSAQVEEAGQCPILAETWYLVHLADSMDWFKGNVTGKPYISRENLWFPVDFPFNQSIDWLIFLRVLGRNWSISDADWSILIRCVWILGCVYLFLSSCRYSHYIRHPKSLAVQCSRLVISATCTRLEPESRTSRRHQEALLHFECLAAKTSADLAQAGWRQDSVIIIHYHVGIIIDIRIYIYT